MVAIVTHPAFPSIPAGLRVSIPTEAPVTRLARAAALALALVPALALAAPQRGPSTPAERKRAVELTRKLEKDPLYAGADKDREWLFEWIVAIPDVNVQSCSGPLDVLVEEPKQHGRQLYAQSVFGMAAFVIQNPKRKDDWVAVQEAGIESTLRAYQALVARDPAARRPELDDLVQAWKQGKLREIVRSDVKCKPDEDAI